MPRLLVLLSFFTYMRRAISLFSGAGGMDCGFSRAGFDVKLAVEIDSACCDTLRLNCPETRVLEESVVNLSGAELLDKAGIAEGELDLLFGGPPCQSFSLAGKRGGTDDDRGKLVFEFVRLVRETVPKAFVMENVKGMVNWDKGSAVRSVIDDITKPIETSGGENVEYRVKMKVLNAADYGVPQNRERFILVGNRVGRDFDFPDATHGNEERPFSTVGDSILNLPPATEPSGVAQRVAGTIKKRRLTHGY